MRLVLHLIFVTAFVFTGPSLAQKLVDPNSVAPEFRDAAEKRRAEQIKVVECNRKANEAKVMPRDRTAYLNHCLELRAKSRTERSAAFARGSCTRARLEEHFVREGVRGA